MIISKSKRFIKSYKKNDNFVKDKFDEKLLTFIKKPLEITLNNHALT